MITLALETSGITGSVAIFISKDLVFEEFLPEKYKPSIQLNAVIRTVANQAGINPGQIEQVIANFGPGTFTGIRVGIAGALGVSNALNIPLFGLGTSLLIAAQWAQMDSEFITYIPRDTKSAYIAQWKKTFLNLELICVEDVITDLKFHFSEFCNQTWIGTNPAWLETRMKETGIIVNFSNEIFYPRASHMAILANEYRNFLLPLTEKNVKYIRQFTAKSKKGDYTWP